MKFKKLESGRSMVEMLGVLAIIGVLSVGGIAGYSLSMRRHRANQIVDAIGKYSTLAYGKCQQKILNGEVNSVTDAGCRSNALIGNYEDTDLGQLPAGVTKINHSYIEPSSGTGADMTVTYVSFTDEKICQAVASIVGEGCYSISDDYDTYVSIVQN